MTINPISKPQQNVLKIAIFSGAIPTTTFIEQLIEGIAQQHQLLLFGVLEAPKTYKNKRISIYKTPRNHWANLCVSAYRSLKLLLRSPRDLLKLFIAIKAYESTYTQWIWYSKLLPIVLYRPDIFHMQWARDLEFYVCLKELFHIPLVVSLRGAHINYTPIIQPEVAALYRTTFLKVDAFHAVSEAIAFEARNYGEINLNTKVIHSPIPSIFFDTYLPYQKHNINPIEILSIGRFHWKKGFRYALDAISFLKDQGYSIRYTIVGSQNINEELLFQIDQLELKDDITLLPFIEQLEMKDFIKTKDILLLPSVEEGIANVVLEAMAIGIPVISTNCGGMNEVVIRNETGWLVPTRDANAIAKVIIEVTKTPEADLQRITQNAHDFVKAHFNAEDSIKQFLELYEEVCGSNGKIPTH